MAKKSKKGQIDRRKNKVQTPPKITHHFAEPSGRPETEAVATVHNDIFLDFLPIGKMTENPDKLIATEGSGKGIELYERLLYDPQVASTLQTRILAVTGREWDVVPATEETRDVEIADFVKQTFLDFDFDATRETLLKGLIMGYKPAEIFWKVNGQQQVVIDDIMGVRSKRFVFSPEGDLRLLTFKRMIDGEEVPDCKFVVHKRVSHDGSFYGDGLGRSLYWPVWFKKNLTKFGLIFADKFGNPTPVGTYPPGYSQTEQTNLLWALEALQQESAITIPDNVKIDLLEASRTGSTDLYTRFLLFFNEEISKVVLGHSAAADSTPGRLGNEKQAGDIRSDYIKADADSLSLTINNTLVKWLVDFNFGEQEQYPKYWIRTADDEDTNELVKRDEKLIGLGLQVTEKYFYDTYNIPPPEDGDRLVNILIKPPSSSGTAAAGGNATQLPAPEFADRAVVMDAQKEIDELADDAIRKTTIDVSQLIDLANSSKDFKDLQRKIRKFFGKLDLSQFEDIQRQALLLAELQGRSLE